MLSLKFHHIGYAVKDIKTTAYFYLKNGWSLSNEIVDPIQNARIAFLKKKGEPLMELVGPVDEKSPINRTLEKVGVSPYHICYEVDNLDEAIKEMKKYKFIQLFKPVRAAALDFEKISYLYSKDTGLIELLEAKK